MTRAGESGRQANPRSVTVPPSTSKSQISEQDRSHVHKPFNLASAPPVGSPYGDYPHTPSNPHEHRGNDYSMGMGTTFYALVKSKIIYAGPWYDGGMNLIVIESLEDRGYAPDGKRVIQKGDRFGYGHAESYSVSAGQEVEAGKQIGKSGTAGSGPHCHFWMQKYPNHHTAPGRGVSGGGTQDGNVDPKNVVTWAYGGRAASIDGDGGSGGGSGGGGGGGGGGGSAYNAEQISKASAYSSILSIPGGLNSLESRFLTGQRSLMNDQPLLPFIEQICGASLRSFMSMPNGKFYAFYPDYFGGFNRQPYWNIADVEIISGKIDLSDDTLATHVFVVGDTNAAYGGPAAGYGSIDLMDKIQTTGVINIFNAFATGFLNGKTAQGQVLGEKDAGAKGKGRTKTKKANNANTNGNYLPMGEDAQPDELTQDGAINFLKKYGARPVYEEVPAIRSPIYETYLAFQRFCMLWASQFKTTFEFTFMPELYPGGIVAFPDHGLQCYVEEVVHSGSYESGFTTMATLSSPAALKNADGNPEQEWVHSGMIRAFVNNPDNFSKPKIKAVSPPKKKPKPKGKKS